MNLHSFQVRDDSSGERENKKVWDPDTGTCGGEGGPKWAVCWASVWLCVAVRVCGYKCAPVCISGEGRVHPRMNE